MVRILVDGEDPFAKVAPGWGGFDPDDILGSDSPLLPVGGGGRRVAVYRCSCGEAGCGSIAPLVVTSADGRYVHWIDFRDFVGRFAGPLAAYPDTDDDEGKSWNLPDLRFALDPYQAEIRRSTADLSWETPRRTAARLLHERLRPLDLVLPPNLGLARVMPAWEGEGLIMSFETRGGEPFRQVVLRLTSRHEDPERAAADMAAQLRSTPPSGWARAFRFG